MSQPLNANPLNEVLLTFNDENGNENIWTAEDAMKAVSILGATGSGKTSASGKAIAKKYLKAGWGGLVLTVKPEEAKLWEEYSKDPDVNRWNDVIMFGNNSKHPEDEDNPHRKQRMVFNPIDYEMRRAGEGAGDTQNIINLFMNIYRMGNRIAQEGDISKEDRFWDSALKRCIGKTVELLKLAREPLTMANICAVMTSCCSNDKEGSVLNSKHANQCLLAINGTLAGKNLEKYEDPIYYCPMCLAMAHVSLDLERKELNSFEHDEYETKLEEYEIKRELFRQIESYFLQFMTALDEKTKATIIESFMGLAEPFTQGILNKHFSGATNITPEETFAGKIIIVNFPVKQYLDVGIIAQCVFKLMFQQAVERRVIKEHTVPVFLWADEAHMFVNPYDQLFLTTARGSRCSTVYLTQSISNYLAVMGSGGDSKSKVDSLMGNLTTKIFHANADAETNEYASRLIGSRKTHLQSHNSSSSFPNPNFQTAESMAAQYLPQIQPMEFTLLRSGGIQNQYKVDAIIFITGKAWTNNCNYFRVPFTQNFTNPEYSKSEKHE